MTAGYSKTLWMYPEAVAEMRRKRDVGNWGDRTFLKEPEPSRTVLLEVWPVGSKRTLP